jgi:hypothetical protein
MWTRAFLGHLWLCNRACEHVSVLLILTPSLRYDFSSPEAYFLLPNYDTTSNPTTHRVELRDTPVLDIDMHACRCGCIMTWHVPSDDVQMFSLLRDLEPASLLHPRDCCYSFCPPCRIAGFAGVLRLKSCTHLISTLMPRAWRLWRSRVRTVNCARYGVMNFPHLVRGMATDTRLLWTTQLLTLTERASSCRLYMLTLSNRMISSGTIATGSLHLAYGRRIRAQNTL